MALIALNDFQNICILISNDDNLATFQDLLSFSQYISDNANDQRISHLLESGSILYCVFRKIAFSKDGRNLSRTLGIKRLVNFDSIRDILTIDQHIEKLPLNDPKSRAWTEQKEILRILTLSVINKDIVARVMNQ